MALEKAERAGDPVLLAVVIARVAQMEMWAAEITPGLLERGVEIEERLGLALEYHDEPAHRHWPDCLTRLGEIERARVMSEELEAKRWHEATRGRAV